MSAQDETVGELVEKVEALGAYTYVDPSGKAWHLKYLGSCRIGDTGEWLDWKSEK